MRILFLAIFLASVSLEAFAQFNDTTNFFLKYSSTGIVNKTNDQHSYVLNNTLRFSFYRKNISLNSMNTWVYGKQQHLLANNDFLSTMDFDLFKTDRHIYYWGLLTYEKSFSLKIDHRAQAGIGLGYYLIDQKAFVFQISDGLLYELSDLLPVSETNENQYQTVRNSLRLKLRYVFKDFITIENIDFIQHSLRDRKDYIIKSNSQVAVKLYKWFSVTLSISYNKLNITDRENLLINYGVTFERYF